jgi:enediyne biosynthesis protein E4
VLADFNNDGRLDMYDANGAITIFEPVAGDPYIEPNMLYEGTASGRFELKRPEGGVSRPLVHTSRGLAWGDIDDDGGIDLLVINRDAAPYLLMNRVPDRGHWMRFRVVGREGRDAHGATVSLTVEGQRLNRDVQVTSSYLSANDPRVHFGLGRAQRVTDVTVRWPVGGVEQFGDFDGDRTVELRQGHGRLRDAGP